VHVHVREAGDQKLAAAVDSQGAPGNSRLSYRSHGRDQAVLDDHGLMLQPAVLVHGQDGYIHKGHWPGRWDDVSTVQAETQQDKGTGNAT